LVWSLRHLDKILWTRLEGKLANFSNRNRLTRTDGWQRVFQAL
jgi:hypothetical protein